MSLKSRSLLALLALAVLAAACGGGSDSEGESEAASASGTEAEADAPSEAGQGGAGGGAGALAEDGTLSGTIEIDGSSTVAPLTDAIAEEYAAVQPDVTVSVGVSGTGGGFERFCAGETQISNASRSIEEEEVAACDETGVAYTEVRVGTDALTMVTNTSTEFLECLTTEEVATLWGPDAPATWDEVNPEFPAEPIQVFAPGADSGTYDFMNETVLEEDAEPRQDYNASEDDNIIAQGIAGTPNSWGFFGFAYFQESGDQLRAVSYDAGEGCVEPSVETAQDDSYGLTRPLFIYVRDDALQGEQQVADFVRFYLQNVGTLIEEVGYIPAPQETIDEAAASVAQAIGA